MLPAIPILLRKVELSRVLELTIAFVCPFILCIKPCIGDGRGAGGGSGGGGAARKMHGVRLPQAVSSRLLPLAQRSEDGGGDGQQLFFLRFAHCSRAATALSAPKVRTKCYPALLQTRLTPASVGGSINKFQDCSSASSTPSSHLPLPELVSSFFPATLLFFFYAFVLRSNS